MKKFKIPVPPTSTLKTIRFPDELIDDINKAIEGTECSFSAFVVEACKLAIEDLNES